MNWEINSFIVIAYLFGSLSSAVIVCRCLRLPDPRQQGSKNPGTTNVLRIGGKKAAILTLLGDMLKGVIPVLLAKSFGLPLSVQTAVAFAAFLGHLFPVFFAFRGGKGVATFLAVLLALVWPVGLLTLTTWLIIAFLFRYSSLGALVSAFLAPVYAYYFVDPISLAIISLMSFCLILRHLENIRRLLARQEGKIKFR